MHDFFVALISEQQQDFVSLSLRFREAMPKNYRKYLIGPIVSDDKSRCFVFLPCSNKVEEHRLNFIAFIKTIPYARYAHVQFGDGMTSVTSSDSVSGDDSTKRFFQQQMEKLEAEWNDRETCLREEIKELIDRKADVETVLNLVKTERDEAVAFRNKDTVLALAVDELKSLRGKKKVIDAAQKVAEDFKDRTDIPESIRNLLEALK
jgi:hypothetical protein